MKISILLPFLAIITFVSAETRLEEQQNFCQGCRSIVSFVSRLNETRSKFENVLDQYCASMPNSTDYHGSVCHYMVRKFLTIVDKIDPVHHCDEIGACGPADLSTAIGASHATDDVFCGICVDSVNSLKNALSDPATLNMLRDYIKSVCSALHVIDADKECTDLMNNYLDQMLEFVQKIDARKYCTSVQLCAKSPRLITSVYSPSSSGEIHPTLGDLMGIGRVLEVRIGDKVEQNVNNEDLIQCSICKRIVKQLENMLKDHATEQEIKNALDQVCSLVYHNELSRNQCDEIVSKYTDEFIHILSDEGDPELVCMLINLCKFVSPNNVQIETKKKDGDFEDLMSKLDETFNSTVVSDVCHECEMFVHFIQTHLSEIASEQQLETLLKSRICQRLPSKDLQTTCYSFVDQYVSTLYQAIQQDLDPNTVCTNIKACKVSNSALIEGKFVSEQFVELEASKYCHSCLNTVTLIDDYLSSKVIQKDVAHLVEAVCNEMPNPDNRRECKLIIETFGPEIIDKIATMANPKQLCTEIKLCSTSTNNHHARKQLLGLTSCTFGPSYWCQSVDHARACSAHDYCQRKVWRAINLI